MRKLIDQQEAIESLKECAEAVRNNGEFDIERGYLNAIECLEEEPSVDAVPVRRGKWKSYRCDMYICSECGHVYTELSSMEKCEANFCPMCGADMRGN